jgi:hypothetical protein
MCSVQFQFLLTVLMKVWSVMSPCRHGPLAILCMLLVLCSKMGNFRNDLHFILHVYLRILIIFCLIILCSCQHSYRILKLAFCAIFFIVLQPKNNNNNVYTYWAAELPKSLLLWQLNCRNRNAHKILVERLLRRQLLERPRRRCEEVYIKEYIASM